MDDTHPINTEQDLSAKKSLGQNFLKNPAIIDKIAYKTKELLTREQKNHAETIKILEIGPGKGALTKSLLKLGHPVVAIETDERMVQFLNTELTHDLDLGLLSLIHTDIREFTPNDVSGPYILVANIPYYLTGYIFRQFLESDHQPLALVVMIQKEVALRMTDKKQSLLSLCANTYGKPSILTHVSKGNFTPAPKVDSSVLVIDTINKNAFKNTVNPGEFEKTYWTLAKKGFNSKRKQIGGTVLKEILKSDTAPVSILAKRRPEELSVADWVEITKNIYL